jgi:hypothetical protein
MNEDKTFASYLVRKWLSLFLKTKNPIYAWRAYENARRLKLPVPCEVIQYLDDVAHQLIKIANNPPTAKVRPLEIAKALGLGKRGAGAASLFKDYTERQRARKIAMETFEEIKKSGKEYVVYQEIAENYRSSESTVRRNYIEHLERWQIEVENLVETGLVEFGKDGKVKIQMQIAGTADDFREGAIILSLIEDKLKSLPT